MRRARGENIVGRKISFTNRAVWNGYGISGPIWNYLFDSTVDDLAADDGTFGSQVCQNLVLSLRSDRQRWASMLSSFTVELIGTDGVRRSGHGQNVLGGPLRALRFLCRGAYTLSGEPSTWSGGTGDHRHVDGSDACETKPGVVGATRRDRCAGLATTLLLRVPTRGAVGGRGG